MMGGLSCRMLTRVSLGEFFIGRADVASNQICLFPGRSVCPLQRMPFGLCYQDGETAKAFVTIESSPLVLHVRTSNALHAIFRVEIRLVLLLLVSAYR